MKILFSIGFVLVCSIAGISQDSRMAEVLRTSERIVRNAPFSADAVSSSVQMFADGNRITRSSTSRLFRDAEGRYRREDMAKQLGVPGAIIDVPESILILDPVSGSRFTLNTKRNTARQTPFRAGIEFRLPVETTFRINSEFKAFTPGAGFQTKSESQKPEQKIDKPGVNETSKPEQKMEKPGWTEAPSPKPQPPPPDKPLVKIASPESPLPRAVPPDESRTKRTTRTENLGSRSMEGLTVEGTRTITTIPAGLIGNERDIEVVYEKWYSNELQLIVFSKHTDPAFGEQTYRLINIHRENPSILLFAPPADYTIVNDQQPKPQSATPVVKSPSSEKKPISPAKQVPTAVKKMTFG